VDLAIPSGANVAIVGRNAAGKSTLLRCVAGLLPVRSGTISWVGRDITSSSAYERASEGMVLVPDGRNVFSALTVRENLALFAQGDDVAPAIDAFPALDRLLDRRAATLSGGERQMVALSHPLLRPARLVLFDEVSRGLSPAAAGRFYDRVVSRRSPERTYVSLVEQYLGRASPGRPRVRAPTRRGRLRRRAFRARREGRRCRCRRRQARVTPLTVCTRRSPRRSRRSHRSGSS
jgi:branched-chain amino acid transport system ATP-binding protein